MGQSQLSPTVRTERRTAVSGGLVYVQEEKCIFRILKLARAEPRQGGKEGGTTGGRGISNSGSV